MIKGEDKHKRLRDFDGFAPIERRNVQLGEVRTNDVKGSRLSLMQRSNELSVPPAEKEMTSVSFHESS